MATSIEEKESLEVKNDEVVLYLEEVMEADKSTDITPPEHLNSQPQSHSDSNLKRKHHSHQQAKDKLATQAISNEGPFAVCSSVSGTSHSQSDNQNDMITPLYPPTKKVKSSVWVYFGYAKKDGIVQEDGRPICRTCRVHISAKGGNTSNMFTHLRDHHPALHSEASLKNKTTQSQCEKGSKGKASSSLSVMSSPDQERKKCSTQPSILMALERGRKFEPASQQAQELNSAVASFIAKDMQPFQIVDRPAFRNLVEKLNPRYSMPGRSYFSAKEIPRMYNLVRKQVEASVAGARWFAATTDLWTSSGGSGEPYMSLTVHYITSEWELKTNCLETLFLPDDHTAENIAESFQELLEEWALSIENMSAITTDNGSNVKKAFRDVMKVNWLHCFGHNLNLAIGKALKINKVESALRACRHLVQGFTRSWKKKRELKKKQAELNVPQHSLVHDVVTRWGSTYAMVARFIEQQQAVCAVLVSDRNTWHLMPKDSDVGVLEDINQILGPLNTFTDSLAAEQYVTMSALKPFLHYLKSEVLSPKTTDGPLGKQMREAIYDDLFKRYQELDQIERTLEIACFIDPRFKANFTEDTDLVISMVIQEAVSLGIAPEPTQTHSLLLPECRGTGTTLPNTTAAAATTLPATSASMDDDDDHMLSNDNERVTEDSLSPFSGGITNNVYHSSAQHRLSESSSCPGISALLKRITEIRRIQVEGPREEEIPLESKVRNEITHYMALPYLNTDLDPLLWWKGHEVELPF